MSVPRRNIEGCDQLRATLLSIALLARIAAFLGGRSSGYVLGVRATIVINPNPEAERGRAENVAKPFMERSCGGQSYKVLEDLLIDNVTLSLRFRCGV
jgi:hypothetical protein